MTGTSSLLNKTYKNSRLSTIYVRQTKQESVEVRLKRLISTAVDFYLEPTAPLG
jgi:hypothetical protein